jgi:hypothetical protein
MKGAMKEKLALRWVAALFILAVSAASFASDRPEPNAFLNRKADTIDQLVREVRTDPVVADRYERHFGKQKDELIEYFGTLHLARLNEEGTYMIYSVDDSGVIKARPQRLKAGSRVFADASGTPVLKASCGNAMVTGSNAQTAVITPSVGSATETMRNVAVTSPESMSSITAPVALTPASPVALTPTMPGQISTGSSNQGLALPAALAAIGGAAAFLGGGGGSAPVPEPASILVIAGALVALKYRRKSK